MSNPLPQIHLSPSILAADSTALGAAVRAAETGGAHSIHVDVMDGRYVANFAFSPQTIADLRRVTRLPLHAHLEVAEPDRCLPLFSAADLIIFQEETSPDPAETIERIRALGCGVGLGVNPGRRLEPLRAFLPPIDLLLLLAVEPGFGGQSFNAQILEKAAWAVGERRATGARYAIGVDGGVNASTLVAAAAAGIDLFIAGTAVFGGGDAPAAEEQIAARVRALAALAQAHYRLPVRDDP